MEARAHDIMIVSSEYTQTSPLFKIPQSKSLIVTRTENPREGAGIGVELDGADVIQMTEEGEEAPAELVVPDFDFVIVSSCGYEWFGEVEVDAADGTVVFFKTVNDCSYAVVPSVLCVWGWFSASLGQDIV